MTYVRVLPRDAFNEGNLLKCIGKVILNLENTQTNAYLPDYVESFDIRQSEDDGSISVANLPLYLRGQSYTLYRPLNSRRPWPLYVDYADDAVSVFNDDGEFTPEFIAMLKG